MDIRLELLRESVEDFVKSNFNSLEIDADEITNTKAIKMLDEIVKVIRNDDIDDFFAVEEIVCIFEKYGISAGTRHDFG